MEPFCRVLYTLVGRTYYHLDGESGPPSARPRGEHEIDAALRRALHGEVAGATPSADAWKRLQRRIERDAPAPPLVRPTYSPASIPAPHWGQAMAFSGLLPRFSQIGAAMLVLVFLLTD